MEICSKVRLTKIQQGPMHYPIKVIYIYIYIWIQNCTNVQQNTPNEVHMGLMANLSFKHGWFPLLGSLDFPLSIAWFFFNLMFSDYLVMHCCNMNIQWRYCRTYFQTCCTGYMLFCYRKFYLYFIVMLLIAVVTFINVFFSPYGTFCHDC